MQIEELATKKDLEQLKQDIIEFLNNKFDSNPTLVKEYLRTSEARKLLQVSGSTLTNMRVRGLLHATRVGHIYYYKRSEINALLNVKQ